MFGFVMANIKELDEAQKNRYLSVYCGLCRKIRDVCSQKARLALRYDMAFLSLLLMSLYEPEETAGQKACSLHPIKPRPWVDNEFIQYGADMNVALAYYKFMDDYEDEKKFSAKVIAGVFEKSLPEIQKKYPRQCKAMEDCIHRLRQLENAGCDNPDLPASCFGELMGELLVYTEDLWAPTLREMGMALGRFIYLADAAVDYAADKKKKRYNPYLAKGMEEAYTVWEEYLVLAMGRCTRCFEKLPLVQDKKLLDNILYSGVWVAYKSKCRRKDREEEHDRSL